mmetsp:Transcript_106746/g.297115  ORF Transcript_106746/g.297115 Transcript_106746/m.297115 type:complete len:270 (+) Transcript_106746:70-879(+)
MVSLRCLLVALAVPLPWGNTSDAPEDAKYMECGEGVVLCGVITLESGLGSGVYHHAQPQVHGLWPQTGHYGNSKCVAPQRRTDPAKVYPCYDQGSQTQQELLAFESHEWEKHGECAGVIDESDYFRQVCALAEAPLTVMQDARQAGKDLDGMAEALSAAGFPVWAIAGTDSQVQLSACRGHDGRWVFAPAADMPRKCSGQLPPSPSPPAPAPTPGPAPAGQCVPGRHGPRCTCDADCAGLEGCVRCAHTGFCTNQPTAAGSQVAVLLLT